MAKKKKQKPVTHRQEEILLLKSKGMTSAEVADELGMSAQTVRTHCTTILERLGANNMTEAVAIWIKAKK